MAKKKRRKALKTKQMSKKPLAKETDVKPFDYFCELWDKFKTTSSNSSV